MARIGKIARLPKSQGESKLVQLKSIHRGEAEARRKRELRNGVTERAEMSRGAHRAASQLGALAALRNESEIFDSRRGKSKLVLWNTWK